MQGKKQIAVDKLTAGDIGALAKLQHTDTGNTLCEEAHPVIFPDIVFPEPCISLAVTAKKQGDEEKVFAGLHRLEEEDPTFKVVKQTETPDTLVSGLGELHLEVICRKLHNKFGVEAQLSDPQIPYRETIKKKVKAQGRHKKQSGGHGQFGDVWIEFEPLFDSAESFEFVDQIVGGVVPRNYIPAVEKGLRESLVRGVLAGYPMVNLRATLYDGSYHPVDSSEMAFKVAASLAYKKGCAEAGPTLLEPIYKLVVTIPDEFMGDIIGDINRRRGRILGMNPVTGGNQEVVAEVPLAEVFKYATDLRSMTQARGSFKMTFERYDELPGNLAEKVIANAKKDAEEE
jgi:elongation factor G